MGGNKQPYVRIIPIEEVSKLIPEKYAVILARHIGNRRIEPLERYLKRKRDAAIAVSFARHKDLDYLSIRFRMTKTQLRAAIARFETRQAAGGKDRRYGVSKCF